MTRVSSDQKTAVVKTGVRIRTAVTPASFKTRPVPVKTQSPGVEDLYHAVFESANDIILVINKTGMITDVNDRLKDIAGYEKSEFIGKNITALTGIMTETSLARLIFAFKKRVVNSPVPPYEVELCINNGDMLVFEISARPLRKDGTIIGDLAVLRDITARKLTEKALQASEHNFRTSMDCSSLGIRISDNNGQSLYANQALLDIFGYENIEEMRKYPPHTHYTPESYANYIQRHEQFIRGEQIPKQVNIDILHKDGTIRNLQVFLKEVFWDGQIRTQNVYNDITGFRQAAEARRLSEENYRNSMDSSTIGVRISDKNDYSLYANQALLDIFGYKNINEIQKSPPHQYYSPESSAEWVVRHEKFLRGEPMPHQLEVKIIRKDGTIRNLQVSLRDVFWNSKQQYQTMYTDITEIKHAEQALKISEQNFRNSIDSSLIGIHIIDAGFKTLYVNKAFLDIFGYKTMKDMKNSHEHERYTPQSYADWVARHQKIVRGEPVPEKIEIDIIRVDGAVRHLQVSRKEVFWNGKLQYQLIYNDITEQKQIESKLEQAAREWRTTFDSISDMISIHDKNNRFLRVNKATAAMLKTTPKELLGKSCHELMHGTKVPPPYCPHLQAIKTGKADGMDTFNTFMEIHLHESASPLFDEKGEIIGSIIVSRDVTQQKRIEEQLILTDRLASIGELSSGIAHELNNPLTSVIGFSQLLMEGDVPENIREELGTVYSEAQRAASIVKNLLTFARKHAPVKQMSQVNTVVEDVLRLRSYEQKVNNIEVETRLDANLPQIMMDHFQMQQVFLNIVVNAESAMLEANHRGKLAITSEKAGDMVKVTFADDGPGISKENLKHIFDPFFTTKEVGKGTGLGLSICHGIVIEHNGNISAASKNGQGAAFIIELPLGA
jgi:PAS domain S-box-containing protein